MDKKDADTTDEPTPRANISLYTHGTDEDETRIVEALRDAGYDLRETRRGFTLLR